MRSFNTSFTTFLAVAVLFLMGGAPIRDFSTTLLVGIISGTYSSLYLVVPLLVLWVQRQREDRCSAEGLVLPGFPVDKGQCREAT